MAAQGHKRVCVIMKKSENTQHITQLCDICLIATAAKKVLKKTRRKNLFLQTITGYVLPINTLLLQENYCCSLILQGGLMVQDLPLTWWAWLSFPSIPPQTHTHTHTLDLLLGTPVLTERLVQLSTPTPSQTIPSLRPYNQETLLTKDRMLEMSSSTKSQKQRSPWTRFVFVEKHFFFILR